jgi:hypothetical protein
MYSPLQYKWRYVQHYWKASNGKGHGVHSPFVFQLITQVLNDDRYFYAYAEVETNTQRGLQGGVSAKNKSLLHIQQTKFSRLLFRLANYFSPSVILELGSNWGIHTAYLSAASQDAVLINISDAQALPDVVKSHPQVDCVLINPDFPAASLDTCIAQLIPVMEEHSVLILAEPHQHTEQEAIWQQLQDHPSVTLTVDLFALGMVFFRKEQKVKQHFRIRF